MLSMLLTLQKMINKMMHLRSRSAVTFISFLLRFLFSFKELADGLIGESELHPQGYTSQADVLQR